MSLRTSTPRKSSKIKIAVSGLALAAAAAGAVSVWPSSSAAQQAAAASQAHQTAPAASRTLGASTGAAGANTAAGQAQLDSVSVAATTQTVARRLTPRQIAWRMLWRFGWRHWQFRWLNKLWNRESSWNVHASNPYSGAYGIPQAVPGSKMSTAGPNWTGSARTQIRWGMRYIKATYGGPKRAWRHELATGWY